VSITAQLEILKSLAAIDKVLAKLNEELETERQNLDGKQRQLEELDGRVQVSQASIGEMERTRNDLVTELRQMSVQVSKSREKLSRCRTEREANAAQREVEELRKLYRDREVEIEKLNGLVDQARSDTEATVAERDTIKGDLGEKQGAVESRLKELETERAGHDAERKELAQKVDPRIFRRYEMIRKRRGSGLSAAVGGSCTVCHITLPPMLFQQIMQAQEMIQCPSCNRILHYEEATQESGEDSTADTQAG